MRKNTPEQSMREDRFIPNKRLGQHFLISPALSERIADAAELSHTDTVLEIGPGFGALTRPLAQRAGRVVAIEKDPRLVTELEAALAHEGIENVTLIHGDILRTPLESLGLPKRYAVVANIPYYLTSRLIRVLLESDSRPSRMILTIQREVAERIIAKPPKMNLLAIAVQAYGKPKILFLIPRTSFSPPPEIDSAVITISNISRSFFEDANIAESDFFRILRAGFGTKRKTLENALAIGLRKPKMDISNALKRLDVVGKRSEALSITEWTNVTRALAL